MAISSNWNEANKKSGKVGVFASFPKSCRSTPHGGPKFHQAFVTSQGECSVPSAMISRPGVFRVFKSRRSRWGFSQVSFGTGGGNPCDKKTQILEGYWSQAFSKVRTVRFWVGEVWFQVSRLHGSSVVRYHCSTRQKTTHAKHHATGQEHGRCHFLQKLGVGKLLLFSTNCE